MFSVVTDTSANLDCELAKERNIHIVPFHYYVNGEDMTCTDTRSFDGKTFYDAMRAGAKVTTSQITPQSYIDTLTPLLENICTWREKDGAFDVVTLLEVMEHIPDVEAAARNAVRLARRFVVVTVPSKPDDNPEHIHLLTKEQLTDLFQRAGCRGLRFDGVPGHLVMIAKK